jgi:hypothetical protein
MSQFFNPKDPAMIANSESKGHSDIGAVVATGTAFFMIVLDTSIVNLALPQIRNAFHTDLTALQWPALSRSFRQRADGISMGLATASLKKRQNP